MPHLFRQKKKIQAAAAVDNCWSVSQNSSFGLLHSFCKKNFQATTENWNLIMCRKAEKKFIEGGEMPFSLIFCGKKTYFGSDSLRVVQA